jgi:hypothetical protein
MRNSSLRKVLAARLIISLARDSHGAAALHKAAPEDAIITLLHLLPVANDITAVIRFIGHHDDDGVSRHGIEL